MSVLQIIKKIKESDREIRLLILGLDNAGKTTVLRRYMGQDIDTVSPTLGFNINTIEYNDKYTVTMWDIGGQSSIRSYWSNYYTHTDGIIWVIDSSDISRLSLCKNELTSVLQEDKVSNASVLILANKQDIPGALQLEEISACLDLDSISYAHHWFVKACSAKDSTGIHDSINTLIDDIGTRLYCLE